MAATRVRAGPRLTRPMFRRRPRRHAGQGARAMWNGRHRRRLPGKCRGRCGRVGVGGRACTGLAMESRCKLVASHRTGLEWVRVGQYVGKLNEHGNNVHFRAPQHQ